MRTRLALGIALALAAAAANAATYTLHVAGTDPTPAGPSYVAGPKVWYRVAGGAWNSIPASIASGALTATSSIVAAPGDLVEVKTQSCNVIAPALPICAAESAPIGAYAPVSPMPYTGISITVGP